MSTLGRNGSRAREVYNFCQKNKTILTGATVPSLPPHLSRKPSGNNNVILPAEGKTPSNSIRVSIRTPRNPGGNHNRLSKSLAF